MLWILLRHNDELIFEKALSMKIRMTKGKIFGWVVAFVLWVLFFYSMTISDRPAAIELLFAILGILATGAVVMLTLRKY